MTYRGHIQNGVVVLGDPRALPEGTEVEVTSIAPQPPQPEHVGRRLRNSRGAPWTCRPMRPSDTTTIAASANHDTLLRGHFFLSGVAEPSRRQVSRTRVELNRVDRPIVTTAWTLLELADHLCDARNRRLFKQLCDALATDRRFELIPAEQSALDRAMELYNARPDKDWSLTDCSSFVIMQDRGVTEALTADHHFEQAGFKAMLK
jgi:predicted nucleic acid-binding protein